MKRSNPSQVIYRSGFAALEWNDCTVHALMNSASISYEEAHTICAMAGRKLGKGEYASKVIQVANEKLGNIFEQCYVYPNPTLSEFASQHPVGKFYVTRRGHAFAVVNGEVVDSTTTRVSPGCLVRECWVVRGTYMPANQITNQVLEEF